MYYSSYVINASSYDCIVFGKRWRSYFYISKLLKEKQFYANLLTVERIDIMILC